jgi:hypothetical protein
MTDAANPLDAINQQIANARAAAASGGAAAAGAPPTQDPTPPAVGGAYQPPAQPGAVAAGRPVTLGELLSQGGMRVDAYLKVDKTGFLIGTDTKNALEEITVEFKLSDVVPFFGLRWGSTPAKYLRSFDRQTESRTKKSWAACVAEAMQADSRCRGDYASADIPFTLVGEDVIAEKGENKGKALVKTGQTLGLTLSITNFKEFASFIKPYDDLRAAGQIPHDLTLRGKLVHKTAEGGGNTYGKADFVDFLAVAGATDERDHEPG